MKKQVLTAQKRRVQTEIEKFGWKIINIDEYEWWEHEVWEIESVWTPIGTKSFITFIVDPQILNDKNAVIMVTVSKNRTANWSGNEGSFELYFNDELENNLTEFIGFLSKLRKQ
jgi:hypothetical protein